MIINHNCCIKLVPLVIFIYNARSHIRQICFYPFEGKTYQKMSKYTSTGLNTNA